jgi:multisubunit Na+/H+ antiporter MnhC subunit
MTLEAFLGHFNYWVFAILLMIGFYAVIAKGNLIKKLFGLSIFQSAVFLMYISMSGGWHRTNFASRCSRSDLLQSIAAGTHSDGDCGGCCDTITWFSHRC